MVEINAEPGAFGSFLRWLDRPGQAVRNVLRGDVGAAGRQALDFLGEALDAPLPGDWIPAATGQDDYVSGSELIGMTEDAPWASRLGSDVAIGVLTDPLSYLSFGTTGAASGAARAASRSRGMLEARKAALLRQLDAADGAGDAAKALRSRIDDIDAQIGAGADELARLEAAAEGDSVVRAGLPFVGEGAPLVSRAQARGMGESLRGLVPSMVRESEAVQALGRGARRAGQGIKGMFGGYRGAPEVEQAMAAQQGWSGGMLRAGQQAISDVFTGVDKGVRRAAGAAIHGVIQDGNKWRQLRGATIAERAADAANVLGVSADEAARIAVSTSDLSKARLRDYVELGFFEDLTQGAKRATDASSDFARAADATDADAYLPRIYSGAERKPGFFADQRKYRSPEELADFLNRNPDVRLNLDARRSSEFMVEQGSQATGKLQAVRKILGSEQASLRDAKDVEAIAEALRTSDPDSAALIDNLMGSNKLPRGVMGDMLRGYNRFFKPAATGGLILPRLAFHVRNKISSVWQAASVEGGRPLAGQAARTIASDLQGAIGDGVSRLFGTGKVGSLKKELGAIDDAFSEAGGSFTEAQRILNDKLPSDTAKYVNEALEGGVINGFVSSENMLERIPYLGDRINDVVMWPTEVMEGLEQRMRLGAYLFLRRSGSTPAEAIARINDTFLDYSMLRGSGAYRTMRDWLPFFAFTAQTIPQQALLLARRPAVGVGLSSAMGQGGDEPVMPYIAEQPSVRIGDDEEGNPQYLMGFGLPVDALSFLPNPSGSPFELGRDIEKNIAGSLTPAAKTAYALITGEDPFFGMKYGGYDRTPATLAALGVPERGEFGRMYNQAADTGAIQPIETALNTFDPFFDERFSFTDALLKGTTGARIASSDPDRAAQLILQEELSRNPRAREYRVFAGDDEETQDLIDALSEARKRSRQKRQAQGVQ